MSIEEANKARFERGLMNLTELEGELLEAMEGALHKLSLWAPNEEFNRKINKAITRAYGHD